MLIRTDLKQIIAKLFCGLSPKESEILHSRFGLENNQKKTLEEIGQGYNLSKERIRQIQAKALERLRELESIKRVKDYE